MSMKARFLALLLALLLPAGAASAMTLPGIDCFSPGLVRWAQLLAKDNTLSAQAQLTIDDAMYARDLSVLGAMLSDVTLVYEGTQNADRLSILGGGETLAAYGADKTPQGIVLDVDGGAFLLPADPDAQRNPGALAQLPQGVSILERVPLASLAAWLEGLETGDALIAGFAVAQPFELERTMSDDGTRLTRIEFLSGAVARESGAAYAVSGFLRQPAGRAPKDTFEIVLTQDEKNFIELSYSALRENEVTRRDRQGVMRVTTALKAAGKQEGHSFSCRLNVTTKNEWTAADGALGEKVTVSARLSCQDSAPEKRMRRLNAVEAGMKDVIRLTTREEDAGQIERTDDITVSVTLDGNDFLACGADVTLCAGGEIAPAPIDGAQAADASLAAAAFDASVERLAAALYPQLGENAREKAASGL